MSDMMRNGVPADAMTVSFGNARGMEASGPFTPLLGLTFLTTGPISGTVFLVILAGRAVRSVSVSLSKRAGQLRAFTKAIYTHDSDIVMSWGTPRRVLSIGGGT